MLDSLAQTVSIVLGGPAGSFAFTSPLDFSNGNTSTGISHLDDIAVADFNSDGRPDLV